MLKEKKAYIIKISVLCFTFVLSRTLFWNIVSMICGENELYLVGQFMSESYFAIFSIILTRDVEYFNDFWKKNPKWDAFISKILYFWGVLLEIMFAAWFGVDVKQKSETDKIKVQEQIKAIPIEIRIFIFVAILSVIMGATIIFDIFSEEIISLIYDILDIIVSMIGLWILAINVKESEYIH